MLDVNNLSLVIDNQPILDQIHFQLSEGDWLMICGPNGSGKSSLIKVLSGEYPYTGQVSLLNRPLHSFTSKERARWLGILDQHAAISYDFTVEEIVRMGRYPHLKGWFKKWSVKDQIALEQVLKETQLWSKRLDSVQTLSGGEKQRVFLAQLFLQDPKILILDEPSNHLDLIFEQDLFNRLLKWLQEPGRAVITVMHDLSLAKKYGNRSLILKEGQQKASGSLEDCFTNENLQAVFGIDVQAYLQSKYDLWNS